MTKRYQIRPADTSDEYQILNFSPQLDYLHRHLDWRMPTDWLGNQPFWILENDQGIQAALAIPADPPDIAWVRFFACKSSLKLVETWNLLFQKALLSFSSPKPVLASVAVQSWFANLLGKSNFTVHQKIVVLEWFGKQFKTDSHSTDITIRKIKPEDIPAVTLVDQSSFDPLWQLSEAGMSAAYRQASYATLTERDGEIVGYQISNLGSTNAHLSRLAVLPQMQRRHIGYQLINDLINHYLGENIRHITVNTQHDNAASLSLYQKMGFKRTHESFPVYVYNPEYLHDLHDRQQGYKNANKQQSNK